MIEFHNLCYRSAWSQFLDLKGKYDTFGKPGWFENVKGEVEARTTAFGCGHGREVGFQDGGYFSRFLKRERISNQTFIAFLNCG